MKLKDEVMAYLLKVNKPTTVKQIAVELAATKAVQDHYATKYQGEALVKALVNTIASSTRTWKGFTYEKIDGVYHLDLSLQPAEPIVLPRVKTTPAPADKVEGEWVSFPYDGNVARGKVIRYRGTFVDVEMGNGIPKTVHTASLIKAVS